MLDLLPTLLFLAVAAYCFRLVSRQPVKVQKHFMIGVGLLCVLLAGGMFGALFASPAVIAGIHGAFWFLAKVGAYIYVFLWFRFTFPRYRFDQLMRLGWRFLIPLSLVNVIGAALAIALSEQWGIHPAVSVILTLVMTVAIALWLAAGGQKPAAAAAQISEGD